MKNGRHGSAAACSTPARRHLISRPSRPHTRAVAHRQAQPLRRPRPAGPCEPPSRAAPPARRPPSGRTRSPRLRPRRRPRPARCMRRRAGRSGSPCPSRGAGRPRSMRGRARAADCRSAAAINTWSSSRSRRLRQPRAARELRLGRLLELERARLDRAGAHVRVDRDAGRRGRAVDEPQPIGIAPSPNSRFPVPITIGKIQIRYSSIRSRSSSVWISPGLPWTWISGPSVRFSSAIASAAITVVLFHSGARASSRRRTCGCR